MQAGAKVRAYDPIAVDNVRKAVPPHWLESRQLSFCDEQYEALDGADALLLVTEWKQFRNPDFDLMKRKLRAPVIFDGRNQYHPQDLSALGFEYYGIGRGKARQSSCMFTIHEHALSIPAPSHSFKFT